VDPTTNAASTESEQLVVAVDNETNEFTEDHYDATGGNDVVVVGDVTGEDAINVATESDVDQLSDAVVPRKRPSRPMEPEEDKNNELHLD
jgi:hypothetical protein